MTWRISCQSPPINKVCTETGPRKSPTLHATTRSNHLAREVSNSQQSTVLGHGTTIDARRMLAPGDNAHDDGCTEHCFPHALMDDTLLSPAITRCEGRYDMHRRDTQQSSYRAQGRECVRVMPVSLVSHDTALVC